MNEKTSVFNNWVPSWVKIPLLVVALIPHLLLLGLFSGNTLFMASVLDADSNDLQFLMSISYAAIVVTLLINVRFLHYFSVRSYIIFMISCSVFILILLMLVKSYVLIIPLRVLEGIFALLEGVIFMPIIISLIKSKHARTISYFILYTLILSAGPVTAWVIKLATKNFGWNEVFYVIAFFHLIVLAISLFLFNGNRFFAKKTLYQLDLISCFYLLISLLSGAFFVIYGFRLNWFQSPYIWYSLFLFLIAGGIFIYRQITLKRKLFDFNIFKYQGVRVSFLLFAVFYIIRYGFVNIYTTMAQVWKWPWEYVVNFQFINVIGVFIGVFSSAILLLKNVSSKVIFIFGFLILAINAHLISRLFDLDVDTFRVGQTVFLQGIGQGWLFTPLVMYILSAVPPENSANASMLGASIRFWFTNIGFAFSQNVMYYFQEKNYDTLKSSIDITRPVVADEVMNKEILYEQNHINAVIDLLVQNDLMQSVYAQANLVASKELFTVYFWFGIFVSVLIALTMPNHAKIKSYLFSFLHKKTSE
nr:hypothetical protein [uncultured Flavobacterium sp.]